MRSEWLFIVRVGPESRQAAIEVLSEVMTFAAFDVPLRLLFLDQGAKLLLAGKDPELSGMLSALALYGVSELFIETASCEAAAGDSLSHALAVSEIPRLGISDFILSHRRVIGG